jgi:SAM-dependent methyltransferase
VSHPFRERWNHNSHHYPRLRDAVPASARSHLDVGCGEGTLCRYVARPGVAVTGVDVDAAVLPRDGGGIHYAVASAEDLPFDDGSFDAVTLVMVLHHVDARRGLAEAARVLAPGGLLQVLGSGRFRGLRDVPFEVRDVLTHQVMARRTVPWEPLTTRLAPASSWDDARSAARDVLPGSTYRRLPLWRYLVSWTKPVPT